jgi:hypothetical protein
VPAQLTPPLADPSVVLQVGQTCTAWCVGTYLVLPLNGYLRTRFVIRQKLHAQSRSVGLRHAVGVHGHRRRRAGNDVLSVASVIGREL